jgi:hypothetical protein
MENRRKRSQSFEFVLLGVLMLLFIAILAGLLLSHPEADVKTTVAGWGGTLLAMIGMIVSFFFGSSKGSQIKDEMLKAPSPAPLTPVPPLEPKGDNAT